jgi:hypothetical protein
LEVCVFFSAVAVQRRVELAAKGSQAQGGVQNILVAAHTLKYVCMATALG